MEKKTARKVKIIMVPDRKLLADKFGVVENTIYNALADRTHSEQAALIRKAALDEFGGIETTKIVWD